MQKTRLIFLRHADTQKDPSVNAAEWGLSEKGKQQAEEVSQLPLMQAINAPYVSEENTIGLSYDEGLGLLADFSLRCHFTDDDTLLLKERSLNFNQSIIAIPETSGIVVGEKVVTVFGDPITLFVNGKMTEVQKSFNYE